MTAYLRGESPKLSPVLSITMVNLPKEYEALLERSKQLTVLGSAGAILQWDMETKMPPRR